MNKKDALAYISIQALSLLAVGVMLFWPAGGFGWGAAWAVLAVWLVWFGVEDAVLIRFVPGLIAERLAPPPGGKSWDRIILSLNRLVEMARYLIAGFDQRQGWTANFPGSLQAAGALASVLGMALFAWSLSANPFFSQVVRIQADRGHAIARTGPYRFIRHPGYLGTILFGIAVSLLLASWWAVLLGVTSALLLIIRTALEDRTLIDELPGYLGYAQQVRWCLVPGIW